VEIAPPLFHTHNRQDWIGAEGLNVISFFIAALTRQQMRTGEGKAPVKDRLRGTARGSRLAAYGKVPMQ
jgi:hypothetical protein